MSQIVETWNVYKDGWIGTEAALRIVGADEVVLGFFLPRRPDAPAQKAIAIFDGRTLVHLTVQRGTYISAPPIAVRNGKIVVQIYCDHREDAAKGDNRKLGVVMAFLSPEVDPSTVRQIRSPEIPALLSVEHPETAAVAQSFDAEHYLRDFDVRDMPSNPLLHFLTLGWKMGRDPNPTFSTRKFMASRRYDAESELTPFAQFLLQKTRAASTETEPPLQDERGQGPETVDLDVIWAKLGGIDHPAGRPDFRLNDAFYELLYRDIPSGTARKHFEANGHREGRFPTRYHLVKSQVPDIDARLLDLLTEPRLKEAVANGQPRAAELAFELISLGSPVDLRVSDFSARYYVDLYPDIGKSGVDPFQHFLTHGVREGRRTLHHLRRKMIPGRQPFDPARPTCMIASHDFSRTGAPAVALKLARDASATHNVVVATLRDGALGKAFRDTCCLSIVTESPFEDITYLDHPALTAIDYAILNSVESFPFYKLLVSRNIPFSSYIHEYTEYTLPAYKAKFTCLFADAVVFSSEQVRASWRGVFADVNFDIERDSLILAQEELPVPALSSEDYSNARDHVSRVLGIDCRDRRLVYGAGQVQIRKGTDLFVIAAQEALRYDPEALFVWIGDGQNHEDIGFGVWLDYQLREVGVNSAKGNLFFIPAGPVYLDLCRAADAMFLPSRLDPLPNVVFDAVRHGTEVVMFENATGFSDDCYRDSPLLKTVRYGDVSSARERLLAVPAKASRLQNLGALRAPEAATHTTKVSPFETIRRNLTRRRTERASDLVVPAEDGDYDVPVLFSSKSEHAALRVKERAKIWSYGRRMVWKSRDEATQTIAEEQNWMHARSRVSVRQQMPDNEQGTSGLPIYGIHIHAYYTDDLEKDLAYYAAYRHASRIVCTTDDDAKAADIVRMARRAGLDVETRVVANRGRDVLPFLETVAAEQELADDFLWCHVHQKKSIGSASHGDAWRRFLLQVLLGDDTSLSSAIVEIGAPNTGFVTALDPYIVGWEAGYRLLPLLEAQLGCELPRHPLLFPVGSMFWVRTSVVRQMYGLFGPDYPWPNEPIPNDGTIYHAIERLWPGMSALLDLESVFLDAPGIDRI